MKKFGFTLTEVLITLGIIGVIAALTTPALVKNSGFAKIGPTLSKFVNTFETASQQMKYKEGFTELEGDEAPILAKYMIMTPYEGEYTFYDATGTTSRTIMSKAAEMAKAQGDIDAAYENCIKSGLPAGRCEALAASMQHSMRLSPTERSIWQLKDGSIMVFAPRTTALMLAEGESINKEVSKGAYKGIVAEILYDIDGNKGAKNKAGVDVYSFLVDRSGGLVPSGSNAHKYITTGTTKQNGTEFMTQYSGTCSTSTNNLINNLACTGKIADNNWSAEY